MRVVLAPCEAESVAVGLFVASGSRHETAKTAGISTHNLQWPEYFPGTVYRCIDARLTKDN